MGPSEQLGFIVLVSIVYGDHFKNVLFTQKAVMTV